MVFERIAVIGISGAGKSTFARALAARTGLPLKYGDQLDWLPNWGERGGADLTALHDSWIAEPRWIIEGWIDPERVARLDRADLVIDLDFATLLCARRVLLRMLRGVRRVEMPDGCIDRFSFQTLKWVLWKQERPFVDKALAAATMTNYLRLTSPREAANWLESL
jgi:adenylate kinase family enzyme